MKPIANFTPHDNGSSFRKLPAGLYVGKIINALANERMLSIKVEITEGEYAGFYQENYETQANGQYTPKYKGYLRLFIPSEKGTKSDEINKSRMEQAICKIEKSNPGYTWDWDERKLAGKVIGLNVRNASWNGNQYTEIGCFESVDDVRNGVAHQLPDKKGKDTESKDENGMTPVNLDDIPF